MASNPLRPIIIVKRKKVVAGGHHGGSWKIAYADFVTAMMAFFMLMWMLGTIDAATLQGIAEYFKTPIKVALAGSGAIGESNVILQGGGRDLSYQAGQVQKTASAEPSKFINLKAAKEALEREELKRMMALKAKLEELIESNPKLTPYKKQLMIDITTEGLRIQILDEKNRPMFALSSAELEPRARDILRALAPTLNSLPNKISLSGHTDAKPYALTSKNYSNWELSSDRAHAARRTLIEGDMQEERLIRVIGLSSSVLLDPQDPLNPINRRISIIVLNNRAEESAMSEGRRQTMALPPPALDDK
jgi:chemotaxis protein MotB